MFGTPDTDFSILKTKAMFDTPDPLSQSTLTLEFTPTDDHFAVQPITTQKPYL